MAPFFAWVPVFEMYMDFDRWGSRWTPHCHNRTIGETVAFFRWLKHSHTINFCCWQLLSGLYGQQGGRPSMSLFSKVLLPHICSFNSSLLNWRASRMPLDRWDLLPLQMFGCTRFGRLLQQGCLRSMWTEGSPEMVPWVHPLLYVVMTRAFT